MANEYAIKLKTLALAVIMITSLFGGLLAMPVVQAAAKSPGAFSILTPTNGKGLGSTTLFNVTWGTSTGATKYNLSIAGASVQNTTAKYYVWNLTSVASGPYVIKVFAYNASGKTWANNNNTAYVKETPGIYKYGNATTNVVAGIQYPANSIKINTSKFAANSTYNFYYPRYWSNSSTRAPVNFTWVKAKDISGNDITVTVTQANVKGSKTFDNLHSPDAIRFTMTGMYIIDTISTTHYGNNPSTYVGYIWVNTSNNYTITISPTEINYGSNDQITITVLDGTTAITSWITVLGPKNESVVNNIYGASGVTLSKTKLLYAGDYTVRAYRDTDLYAPNTEHYYQCEDFLGYTTAYGSDYSGNFPAAPYIAADYYNWSLMGPWDPPEYNATQTTFTVNTGIPIMTVTNTSFYWGDDATIQVNITNSTGAGIAVAASNLFLKHGNTYYHSLYGTYVNSTGHGNYTVHLHPWVDLSHQYAWTTLVNGTWYIVFGYNLNGKDYEWNTSEPFTINGASPVRLQIVNDGSGKATDKKINVPAYSNNQGNASTVNVTFDILGTSLYDKFGRRYYGDNTTYVQGRSIVEDWKNISFTGDILYQITNKTLTHISNGRWIARVVPTKPGGSITFTINWPGSDNGTASQTLQIVNGTNVAVSADKFPVGTDFNLTVTVTDTDGIPVKTANVTLMWQDLKKQFNSTTGQPGVVGNGKDGKYTFWIKKDDQLKAPGGPRTAPQNITIAAKWTTGYWGYAKTVMQRQPDMIVNITPTAGYAGDTTEYTISVSRVSGGHPPNSGLVIELYNSVGQRITPVGWPITGHYNPPAQSFNLSGGTYTIYAHNDTRDSTGHNATLVITNYTVTSSPGTLVWMIDKNVDMTFQVSPEADGTLRLMNMSGTPNGSYVGQSLDVDIVNGTGSLNGVNATTLGNITYEFTPTDGMQQLAEGLTQITIPALTPSPLNVNIGSPATVHVLVSRPGGEVIPGVTITFRIPGYPDEYQYTSNDQGNITFSFIPFITGDITMKYKNETSDAVVHIVYDIPPVAAFSWTSINYTVQFTSESTDADGYIRGYFWVFGDGTNSTASNPSHTYSQPGTYLVTLEVTDNYDMTNFTSHSVTVSIPPIASFTYSPKHPYVSKPVQFTDNSSDPDGSIVSWLWYFGDGYYSTLENPVHSYPVDGAFIATLIVTDNDGFTNMQNHTVIVLPNSPPSQPSSPVPVNGSTNVSVTTNLSWVGGDPDNDQVTYDVYFGDTTLPPMVSYHQPTTVFHPESLLYNTTYYWRIITWDEQNCSTEGPLWYFTTKNNLPPSIPVINGPGQGEKGKTYNYSFISNDPENQDVYYQIDWGDGTVDPWYGPVHSNEIITRSHQWNETGSFVIKARAKDILNATSDWGTLSVTMPQDLPSPQAQQSLPGRQSQTIHSHLFKLR